MVTVQELKQEAAKHNIKGRSTMNKAQLCSALAEVGVTFDNCVKGARQTKSGSPRKRSPKGSPKKVKKSPAKKVKKSPAKKVKKSPAKKVKKSPAKKVKKSPAKKVKKSPAKKVRRKKQRMKYHLEELVHKEHLVGNEISSEEARLPYRTIILVDDTIKNNFKILHAKGGEDFIPFEDVMRALNKLAGDNYINEVSDAEVKKGLFFSEYFLPENLSYRKYQRAHIEYDKYEREEVALYKFSHE